MRSPITGGADIAVQRSISSWYIIQSYLESYGVDVTRLFYEKETVEEFKCQESGLRFFGPDEVAGDSAFYESLQQFPWYYMEWKWEHEIVSKEILANERVLEIGCAEGAFLKGLGSDVKSTGLELNVEAAKVARDKGLDVHTETIQDFAETNEGEFDVVCSFQVMEHVTDVKGIIEASLKVLKPGGRLIISVPNNDSFIRHSPDSILNMPPHHMNLWDEESLANLPAFFKMDLRRFQFEPLQTYHFPVIMNNFVERWCGKGLFGKLVKKPLKWTGAHRLVGLFAKEIKGHSIIATYSKP